jgi:hypothetical protein
MTSRELSEGGYFPGEGTGISCPFAKAKAISALAKKPTDSIYFDEPVRDVSCGLLSSLTATTPCSERHRDYAAVA